MSAVAGWEDRARLLLQLLKIFEGGDLAGLGPDRRGLFRYLVIIIDLSQCIRACSGCP